MAFAFWHLPLHTGALPLPERPRLAAAVDFWRLPLFFGSKKWLTSRQELETNHSVVRWNNQIISTWIFFVVIFVCNVKCCTFLSKSTFCRDKPTSPASAGTGFNWIRSWEPSPEKQGPHYKQPEGGSFHQLWWEVGSVCCHHAPYLRKSHHYGCTVISVAISTKESASIQPTRFCEVFPASMSDQLVTDNPQLKPLLVSFCVSIRYSFRFQHKNLHHERTRSIVQSVFFGSYYICPT